MTKTITASRIGSKVSLGALIILGLCEVLEKKIEMITKWKVIVEQKAYSDSLHISLSRQPINETPDFSTL
jgi:hypothetical protein